LHHLITAFTGIPAFVFSILLVVPPGFAQDNDSAAADKAAKAMANANNPLANMVAFNIFIEPQWTILHDGVGQPEFTVFVGLNMQFLPK
jgi:hypothetical protein